MLGERQRKIGSLPTHRRGGVSPSKALIEKMMEVIARTKLDARGSDRGIEVRIFKPIFNKDHDVWSCRIEVDPPISFYIDINGADSLQSLVLALRAVSSCLYGSELYRKSLIGMNGEFGGNLFLPAPHDLLGIAPFPF
jgi:hypothetical protein